MSYRFGLSPADIVTDARGNVLNTNLTLYVAEADADARVNALATVPVSSGNWSYTSNTYKSLWARTTTSDPFPVVSVDAQIASLGTAVNVTDNGDGGFTLSGFKLAGWQWVKDTFVSIANAVALATTTPSSLGTAFAGTANTASRGDHVHPMPPTKPFVVGFTSGMTGAFSPQGGNGGASLNRVNFAPVWVSNLARTPVAVTALGVYVSTAASAGGTIRFGVYGSTANGLPDLTNKLFETGEISSTTVGPKLFSITTTLPEWLYWIGVVAHTATCQLQTSTGTIQVQDPNNSQNTFQMMYKDGVTGALPTSGINVNGDIAPQLLYTAA